MSATTTSGVVTKRTVFFAMVKHPAKGWRRVGNAYGTKKTAQGWLPFVRGSFRGCRVRVGQCTLRYVDGVLDERSKAVLLTKFNLEA